MFKYKRFKDGKCTYKTTGSGHVKYILKSLKENLKEKILFLKSI